MDDTPDGKVQAGAHRRGLGFRARPARKGRMRKLSYECVFVNRRIDRAVKAINRRKREMWPKPWMPGVPPWETAIEQGHIRVGDGLAFHSIADVCRCFGRNPKRMQRCYFSLQHEHYHLWCPKLRIEMPDGAVASAAFGITNALSYDGKTSYQTTHKYKAGPADDILRVTFARGKDELGRTAYRFIGVFRHDGPKEDDPWTGVDVRVADEVDLALELAKCLPWWA